MVTPATRETRTLAPLCAAMGVWLTTFGVAAVHALWGSW